MLPEPGLSDEELVTAWLTITEGFAHTQHRLTGDLERGTGLGSSWFDVLFRLMRAPDHRLPMHSIVADMAMSSGGFTKLADRMTEARLVERQASGADRRVTFLSLTDEGRYAARRAMAGHVAALHTHVLDRISAEEMTTLADAMRGLWAHAGRVQSEDGGRRATSEQAASEQAASVNGGEEDRAG